MKNLKLAENVSIIFSGDNQITVTKQVVEESDWFSRAVAWLSNDEQGIYQIVVISNGTDKLGERNFDDRDQNLLMQ